VSPPNEPILIVEDEETLRRNLARFLAREGHDVDAVSSAEEALELASHKEYSVALVDVRLPGKDGISLASDLLARWPDIAVVVTTAYASVESVIDALRAGVQDYLVKPVLMKDAARKIARACEHRRLLRDNARLRQRLAAIERPTVIAESAVMVGLVAAVRQLAGSLLPVLFQGESGAGKEVLARLLHDASPRAAGPFVAVSTAAIPEGAIETCLFGHEPGVLGAGARREGLFRAASGGTLFLDDVGDMPLAHQAKVLRAIEAREVLPVGGDRPVPVDARVVAATALDLAALAREGRFRQDLYFRLSALRVDVPPLRAHPDDITPLARLFLERVAREQGRAAFAIDAAAERVLLSYSWPGNVRELANVIERAALLCPSGILTAADLPPEIKGTRDEPAAGYQKAMEAFERSLLRSALERAGGDRRAAAQALGLPLATLYRRIDKLGLKDPPGAPS
jgi:DNA-binding NtrC family response regulator